MKKTKSDTGVESSLLSELEGLETPSGTKTDAKVSDVHTHEQSPDPLDAANHEIKLTAAEKAEKTRADMKARGVKGYKVTVAGDYYAPLPGGDGRKKVKKPYEVSFNLASVEKALSIIVGRLLDKGLKLKYPDYDTHRTCEIINVETLSDDTPEPTNLKFMAEDRLLRYIEDHRVPVDPKNYVGDVAALRRSVIDYVQNPKDFKTREERRLADLKMDADLAKLNPDLDAAAEAPKA